MQRVDEAFRLSRSTLVLIAPGTEIEHKLLANDMAGHTTDVRPSSILNNSDMYSVGNQSDLETLKLSNVIRDFVILY